MLDSSAAGFATGLSLIVAIGAQNAYVLRQGVRRSHVLGVVAICAISDLVLIFAGVAGIGTLVDRAGWLIDVVRWLGVAFLLWYAAASVKRALSPESLTTGADDQPTERRRAVLGRAVALTWLNPHVYLDTVLLLGSVAAAHDDGGGGRWWFAVGAAIGSLVWFSGLGFGARLLAPLLARPRAWQILDLCVAATMVVVAVKLALG